MKKVYIAFEIKSDGGLYPHKHPVFTGDVAHDLNGEQSVQVCEELDVREFVSPGEAIAAVQDYIRETPGAEAPGNFVLLERYTSSGSAKPKTKEVKTKKGK
jgi:hypothetical protein